jgi:hypothetical protein
MILSCEHHSGMGLCSECAREVERSMDEGRRRQARRERLEQAIRGLEIAGQYDAARRMREKLARV